MKCTTDYSRCTVKCTMAIVRTTTKNASTCYSHDVLQGNTAFQQLFKERCAFQINVTKSQIKSFFHDFDISNFSHSNGRFFTFVSHTDQQTNMK